MERGKVHQARRLTNLCLGNRVRYNWFSRDGVRNMKRLSRLVAGFLMIGVLAACATATSMGPGGPGTTR